MTTLAIMKARIAREIVRTDLTDAIADEINDAIKFYRSKRLWISERWRSTLFYTVPGQTEYDATAHANVPHLIRIDAITIGNPPQTTALRLVDTETMERLLGGLVQQPFGGGPDDLIMIDNTDGSGEGIIIVTDPNVNDQQQTLTGTGRPTYYAYYGQVMRLYPPPDQPYLMYISGVVRIAAPVTDGEANNPWMTDGEELIRSRAKSRLFANSLWDAEQAQAMSSLEADAFQALVEETSSRSQVSEIIPDSL